MVITGVVKWFDEKKGFGFIVNERYDEDIMAHFSEIKMEGFKTLKSGDVVNFEIDRERTGGLAAKNISVKRSA